MKTKVAWVSQHPPLSAQKKVLEEKLGETEFVILNDTYKNANTVFNRIRELKATYVVVVLPLSMTRHLLMNPAAKNITFLTAIMETVTGKFYPETDVCIGYGQEKRHKRFKKFEILMGIEFRTKPFEVEEVTNHV